jgi:hypothetical protein
MKIKNKKGYAGILMLAAHGGVATGVVLGFKIAFLAIAAACIWHIPAWEKAKDTHTEAIYQAQQMWPQQLFSGPRTAITYTTGNGGNLVGGAQTGG